MTVLHFRAMRRAIVCLAAVGCLGCTPDAGKSDSKAQAERDPDAADGGGDGPVVDESSKDPRRNPLAEPDFGEPSLLRIEPAPPDLENKPGTRPFALGWSKSGEEFGYCVGTGTQSCTQCEFMDLTGNLHQMTNCEGDATTPDAAKTKEIEEKVAQLELGTPDAKWKYGEVTLVWDVVEGRPTERVAARLRVGGQVDTRVPVYSKNVREDGYRRIWPEMIWLDPTGEKVGIVSHAFDEEGALESFQVHLVDANELASMAFNGAGLLSSHSEDYEGAIDLFHKAAAAWKGQKWSMYNMACAMALTKAPGVQAALTAAVERGGAEVKAKLSSDPDLQSVRDEAWFEKLSGR